MPAEPHLLSPLSGAVLVAVLAAMAAWVAWTLRVAHTRSAWRQAVQVMGGRMESERSPMKARGEVHGMAAFLREAVSYEDEAPYAHTRGALNVRNPANVVMGLRHKSLLEEVATRREQKAVRTGDEAFDGAFFLVLTPSEHAETLLPEEVRRALMRWSDVEIYLKGARLEWRRAGTLRSARDITSAFEISARIAETLASLPPRHLTPAQRQEEEALIEGGV